MKLWIGHEAGTLSDRDDLDKLARAGFGDARLGITRTHGADQASECLSPTMAGPCETE